VNNTSLPHLIDPTTGQQLSESDLLNFCEYYDGIPVLFAIKNHQNCIFFVVWADSTKHKQTWIYAPITRDRYEQAMANADKTELRKLFLEADGDIVYKVVLKPRLSPSIQKVPCCSIIDNWLPRPGEFIQKAISEGNIIDQHITFKS
jgi:hypothetical protein